VRSPVRQDVPHCSDSGGDLPSTRAAGVPQHATFLRHEQGRHAAEATRARGQVGSVSHSGPGATNLVTDRERGMTRPRSSRSPAGVDGAASAAMRFRSRFHRITMPITKQSYLVRDIADCRVFAGVPLAQRRPAGGDRRRQDVQQSRAVRIGRRPSSCGATRSPVVRTDRRSCKR